MLDLLLPLPPPPSVKTQPVSNYNNNKKKNPLLSTLVEKRCLGIAQRDCPWNLSGLLRRPPPLHKLQPSLLLYQLAVNQLALLSIPGASLTGRGGGFHNAKKMCSLENGLI